MAGRMIPCAAMAVTFAVTATLVSPVPVAANQRVFINQDVGTFSVAWSAADRAVYVAGNFPAGDWSSTDIFVRRYSTDGRLVWQQVIATSADEYARGIAVDPQGGVVVAGWRVGRESEDVLVARFSARGVQQWLRLHDASLGGDNRAHAVAVDDGGRIWVAGREPSATEGSSRVWWSRWNSAGRLVEEWTTRGSIVGRSEAWGISVHGDRVLLAGSTFEIVDQQVGIYQDAWVGAFRTDGTTLWERTWGERGADDVARAVAVDRVGQIYVTGEMSARGDQDVFVRRYRPSGQLAWRVRFAHTGADMGTGIAVTPRGTRVVVTGTLGENSFDSEGLVRVYTSGGGLVWSRTTPGAALGAASPSQVYVAGRATSPPAAALRVWPSVRQMTLDQGRTLWSDVFDPLPAS